MMAGNKLYVYIILMQIYIKLGNLIQHDLHQHHIYSKNLPTHRFTNITDMMTQAFLVSGRKSGISIILLSA